MNPVILEFGDSGKSGEKGESGDSDESGERSAVMSKKTRLSPKSSSFFFLHIHLHRPHFLRALKRALGAVEAECDKDKGEQCPRGLR